MGKKLTLEFLQYNIPKPNGDRATRNTDCYNFEIRLNDKLIQEFSQFDGFYCHVNDYDKTVREAQKWVENLADILEIDRPKLKTMVKKVVHEEQWVVEETAEEIGQELIKRDLERQIRNGR